MAGAFPKLKRANGKVQVGSRSILNTGNISVFGELADGVGEIALTTITTDYCVSSEHSGCVLFKFFANEMNFDHISCGGGDNSSVRLVVVERRVTHAFSFHKDLHLSVGFFFVSLCKVYV